MNINEYIDSTNLSKTGMMDEIIKLCDEAVKYHFPCVILPSIQCKLILIYHDIRHKSQYMNNFII